MNIIFFTSKFYHSINCCKLLLLQRFSLCNRIMDFTCLEEIKKMPLEPGRALATEFIVKIITQCQLSRREY